MTEQKLPLSWPTPPSSFGELWPRCEAALEVIRGLLFAEAGALTRVQLTVEHQATEYFHCCWQARLTSPSFEIVGEVESGGDWRDYMTSGDLGLVLLSVTSAKLQLRLRFSVGQPLQVEILAGDLLPEALVQLGDKLSQALNTTQP